MANYGDLNVEQLKEEAKGRGLTGYSTKNKDELVALLEESDSAKPEQGEDSQSEAQEATEATEAHNLEASDPHNPEVQEGLSPEGQAALEEVGVDSEYAKESDLALDASGPLHFESPASRPMTGAVSEEHAKEQEKLLKNKPDDFVGEVTEAGFDKDGKVITGDRILEKNVSRKDNLGPGDDRELYETRQEDIIDFPPPVGKRDIDDPDAPETVQAPASSAFSSHIVGGGAANDYQRGFSQKSQLYTDDLSGGADHNLERAYEYPERLQSNDPNVREAGDQSVSEALWDAKSGKEKKEAETVKSGEREQE